MYIILSNIGCCGDLVSAVIDNVGVNLHADGYYLWFEESRNILKKDSFKDVVISDLIDVSPHKVLETYQHKIKIEFSTKKYSYITIDSSDEKACNWMVSRMDKLYPSHGLKPLWIRSSNTINNYYADYIIKLEDILEGKLIEKLQVFVDTPLDEKLYRTYLSLLLEDYPFN
jgi:hypothetical protein